MAFPFFLESKRKSTSDHYRQWNGEWGLTSVDPSGGGGHSLIWPIRVCAAEQGMVFKTGYTINKLINRVYNFTIEHLKQGVFLDWKPFKECKDLQ